MSKHLHKLLKQAHKKAASYENQFNIFARQIGVPVFNEYKFHAVRKWRFDFAFVSCKVAVEINGGVWIGGRHNRGSGYVKDMEKINAAQARDWVVLQYTPQNINFTEIEKVLEKRKHLTQNE